MKKEKDDIYWKIGVVLNRILVAVGMATIAYFVAISLMKILGAE